MSAWRYESYRLELKMFLDTRREISYLCTAM